MGNLPSVRSAPKMDEFCRFKVHLRLKKDKARLKDGALESLDFCLACYYYFFFFFLLLLLLTVEFS